MKHKESSYRVCGKPVEPAPESKQAQWALCLIHACIATEPLHQRVAMQQVARMRQSRPVVTAYAAPAAPTEAKAVGMMKPIKIGGRFYTWRQLSDPAIRREILPQVDALIAQVRRDPSAFGYTAEDVKAA